MPIFDRFLRYRWAEHALELAVQDQSPRLLKDWLLSEGVKGESARRTANVLTWLWFPKDQEALTIRNTATNLFPILSLEAHRILHWGMAILVFPNFSQTVRICGRLLRLQGEFNRPQVITRVLEQYSNQSTVRRSTERILQTLTDWGLLVTEGGKYRTVDPIAIEHPELCVWLTRCVLASAPDRYVLITDLPNAPEFFPFGINGVNQALRQSSYFTIQRNADGDEVIGLCQS